MSKHVHCKLLVIGGGPGGYVCAIRAGQLGVDTILVERAALGGTCLNVGCIPSKALIHAAEEFHALGQAAAGRSQLGIKASAVEIDLTKTVAWKDGLVGRLTGGVETLLRKAKVNVVRGSARFIDGKNVEIDTQEGPVRVAADKIVIATGSVPVELPALPFGGPVISSTGALSLREVPRRLVVVGGGYIGLEIGIAFRKLGAEVTVVEAASSLLPQYDADLTRPVTARLKVLGVKVLTETSAIGPASAITGLAVRSRDGAVVEIPADRILVAVGRAPLTTGFGLEELDLQPNGKFIGIDDSCQTSMRGVFAIGDVTGEPMLAHRAMAQGEMVAEIVSGAKRGWDKYCIPAVCFTDPEIVTVGLSPEQARAQALEVRIGMFPFRANGRAMTRERDDGFVRVVSRADDHTIVGIQATGAGIAELVSTFALAVEMGARLEDIAGTIHAHPTLGEALQEAAFAALGKAIHA